MRFPRSAGLWAALTVVTVAVGSAAGAGASDLSGAAADGEEDAASLLRGKTFLFYYLWYGNPAVNGRWQHWDHEVLPHWTASENARHPTVGTRHDPNRGILHSPYYPKRGPYSSTDPVRDFLWGCSKDAGSVFARDRCCRWC